MPNKITGSIATDPLLSIASTNASKLSQYREDVRQALFQEGDSIRLTSPLSVNVLRNCSLRKYHQIDSRKNNSAMVFLR